MRIIKMCTVRNDPIPIERMPQFIELLGSTGGRFLTNPRLYEHEGVYRCDYKPGDYETFCMVWRRLITPIKEVRKDQWWRKAIRRLLP